VIAESANKVVERILEVENLETLRPEILRESIEELNRSLKIAQEVLAAYDKLLIKEAGHGAIKGLMVRGALNRINPLLQEVH
jgi:hypothetical protein